MTPPLGGGRGKERGDKSRNARGESNKEGSYVAEGLREEGRDSSDFSHESPGWSIRGEEGKGGDTRPRVTR